MPDLIKPPFRLLYEVNPIDFYLKVEKVLLPMITSQLPFYFNSGVSFASFTIYRGQLLHLKVCKNGLNHLY
ncbi:hypothetical protein ADICYQ_2696 [Cyclobacterium qasimii M12-11B]|uniref:Uncharacterized protein n=1 Tax=Cyclobacterium qasimii M12-11B TaxID=641524 RepID=S7VE09_9BACT|nr:hypothetical protein ADICYQ_2696 [Cyclobacterium qasimii M12-11B]